MRFDHESTADVVFVAVLVALLLASVVPTQGAGATVVFGVSLDKWLHAGGFTVLTVSLAAVQRARGRRLARVAVLALALGAAIELVQLPIPWRHADSLDLVADAVGVVVGVVVWSAWTTQNHPHEREPES